MAQMHRGGAHEWRPRNAHPGDLRGGGPTVAELPVHQERLGEDIAQEAEPRHDRGERVRGHDVEELDLEDVTGARALDEDRTGERMDGARFHPR